MEHQYDQMRLDLNLIMKKKMILLFFSTKICVVLYMDRDFFFKEKSLNNIEKTKKGRETKEN